MSSTASSFSNVPFAASLKVDPTLHWHKFHKELITFAGSLVPSIIPSSGVMFAVVPLPIYEAYPGNLVANAAGVLVPRPIYDLITPQPACPQNATNAQIKIHENIRTNTVLVQDAVALIKGRLVVSLPDADRSHLDHPVFGLMNHTCIDLYVHLHGRYGTLEQADFTVIFDRLKALKSPTQDYAALAEVHRDLHALLHSAGHPSTEYAKTTAFMDALREDYQGHAAVAIYVQNHPQISARNFNDLVNTVILQAPTIVPTNVTLGYSSAMSTSSATSAFAAPTDAVALAQQISKAQRDLAALLKRQRGPSTAPTTAAPPPLGGSAPKYCHKHGYQKSHAGTDCLVMKGNPAQYTVQHLSAKDHLTPPGGNPTNRG